MASASNSLNSSNSVKLSRVEKITIGQGNGEKEISLEKAPVQSDLLTVVTTNLNLTAQAQMASGSFTRGQIRIPIQSGGQLDQALRAFLGGVSVVIRNQQVVEDLKK